MSVDRSAWQPGVRVVVRRRLAEGGFTDVLGDVVESTAGHVVVRTRRGDVTVPADEIALGKQVPPAPMPRPRRGA